LEVRDDGDSGLAEWFAEKVCIQSIDCLSVGGVIVIITVIAALQCKVFFTKSWL